MKIPRDVNANLLVKLTKIYSYSVTRQSGSHIRLTTLLNGEHHVTIPNHNPIKIGTLSAILSEIAQHVNKPKEEIIKELF
jgi:predicted RNA binding protein YcfA (HicA-like mRNA interferase family)